MTAPRPKCVHCGAAYGKRRTETAVLVWRKGEPRPPYRGNGIVNRDCGHHGPTSLLEAALGRPKVQSMDEYAFLDIWDGERWGGGYKPFCTLRCALEYARKVYAERYAEWKKVR